MNIKQKGSFLTVMVVLISLIIVAVILVIVIKSQLTINQSIQPSNNVITPVATTTNQATTTEIIYKTYQGTVHSHFEGTYSLGYVFKYPASAIITDVATNTGTILNIKDNQTGQTVLMYTSDESGRGFKPEDYWNNSGKNVCSDCVLIPNSISIANASDIKTYSGQTKEVVIFSTPKVSQWLFVVEGSKELANTILNNFLFDSSTKVVTFKTYTDPLYNFSFQYPQDLLLTKNDTFGNYLNVHFPNSYFKGTNLEQASSFSIKISKDSGICMIDPYTNNTPSKTLTRGNSMYGYDSNINDSASGGLRGVHSIYIAQHGGNCFIFDEWLAWRDYKGFSNPPYPNDIDKPTLQAILDGIFASFNFTS